MQALQNGERFIVQGDRVAVIGQIAIAGEQLIGPFTGQDNLDVFAGQS